MLTSAACLHKLELFEESRGEFPYGSCKAWPQTQPLNLSQTHTLIFYAVLSSQEECYRLTQRKSACRPVLTLGLSLLWPGQCPTVSLEAASTQHRKQLSGSTMLLLSSFGLRTQSSLIAAITLPLLVCLLLSQFIHISTFQPYLKCIRSFSTSNSFHSAYLKPVKHSSLVVGSCFGL